MVEKKHVSTYDFEGNFHFKRVHPKFNIFRIQVSEKIGYCPRFFIQPHPECEHSKVILAEKETDDGSLDWEVIRVEEGKNKFLLQAISRENCDSKFLQLGEADAFLSLSSDEE